MASNIYGELIKAQLQNSAADLTPVSTGLIYFNTSTGVKWYTGSVWKTAVDLDSSQTLTFKTLDGATVLTNLDLTDNASIRLFESSTNGSNKVLLRAPVTLAADYALILPTAQAQVNQFLKNDGVGNLSWAPASGGAGRNYLSDWNDASRSIGTVVTGLTSTGNRTSSQTSWGSSATADLTIANNATVPLRETGDFLIDSSTSTSGAFVESPMFNLDLVDLSKAVVLSFDITGNAADGNYDVVVMRYNSSGTYQETISVAGNASSGTPASAKLPTGTTTFKGFFVSSNTQTDLYSVRIRKTAAVNDDFQIDSLFVGPQSLGTGAVVTAPQVYSPVYTGLGTVIQSAVYYSRVGTRLRMTGSWKNGTPTATPAKISLPAGLTVNTGIYVNNRGIVGNIQINDTTLAANTFNKFFQVITDASDNSALFFTYETQTIASGNTVAPNNGSSIFNANSAVSIVSIEVEIAEWTSNVTTAERAVEEYAFNTSTSDADDITSFGYGPQGTSVPGNLSATREKRVRFNSIILPTDKIFVEIINTTSATWTDAVTWFPNYSVSTNQYGILATTAPGTNEVTVYFRQNADAYAGGRGWGTFTSQYKWRVRKVQSGAAVGFPVSSANVIVNHNLIPTTDVIKSGTYTPTVFGPVNCNVTAIRTCRYTQIGKVVTVTGFFVVNATASVAAEFFINLPIPTDITSSQNQLSGLSIHAQVGAPYASGFVVGDPTTDRAQISWRSGADTANRELSVNFTYELT